jgi:hypothetical protein
LAPDRKKKLSLYGFSGRKLGDRHHRARENGARHTNRSEIHAGWLLEGCGILRYPEHESDPLFAKRCEVRQCENSPVSPNYDTDPTIACGECGWLDSSRGADRRQTAVLPELLDDYSQGTAAEGASWPER